MPFKPTSAAVVGSNSLPAVTFIPQYYEKLVGVIVSTVAPAYLDHTNIYTDVAAVSPGIAVSSIESN
jgi:hypothetical protein